MSNGQMKQISATKYKIKELWNWCEERIFAVLEIQREFVWDKRRISDLLDSIYPDLLVLQIIFNTKGSIAYQLVRHPVLAGCLR